MAEQYPRGQANNSATDEIKGHGFFDLMTKKEDKAEDVVMTDHQLNALKESKEEKHTLMDELQRTHSRSSSSSDEEIEEGGERKKKKKKKKKGLKDAIKEKISCHDHKQGENDIEKCNEEENVEQEDNHPHEENKGFLEKMKEKLPGHKKGIEEEKQTPPEHSDSPGSSDHAMEKKGIIDMIKDKLPGHHKNINENYEVKKDK